MKNLTKIFALGAAMVAAAPFASATPLNGAIGITGSDTFTSNSITFMPNTGTVNATSGIPFSTFQGDIATLQGFTFNTAAANGVQLFTTTNAAGQVLNFVISTITSYGPNPTVTGPNVGVSGTGVFSDTYTGSPYTPTLGTFNLQTSTNGVTTFQFVSSASQVVTPEPSSLILLGSGLVSAAGMMIRRRRIV